MDREVFNAPEIGDGSRPRPAFRAPEARYAAEAFAAAALGALEVAADPCWLDIRWALAALPILEVVEPRLLPPLPPPSRAPEGLLLVPPDTLEPVLVDLPPPYDDPEPCPPPAEA